jgi:pimeloyl-ACP methyl ester carboxylesterase
MSSPFVNHIQHLDVNGSRQWTLLRGKSSGSQLLLHVQAGPGFPMIPEAEWMWRTLKLEEEFLVAYWDQRGCGKSFDPGADPDLLSLDQSTSDIITVSELLMRQFAKRNVLLVGYSIGASCALMAAHRRPDLFSSVVLAGTDIDIPAANASALDFMHDAALASGDKNRLRQIDLLRSREVTNSTVFQQRARLLTDLGGMSVGRTYSNLSMTTMKNLLLCPSYSIMDKYRTVKGMESTQNAMLPELNTFSLPANVTAVDIPVHFVHGTHDGISPFDLAIDFSKQLKTPSTVFHRFEHSAHMPHYDEPDAFSKIVKELRQ